jgi:hypothetical protein
MKSGQSVVERGGPTRKVAAILCIALQNPGDKAARNREREASAHYKRPRTTSRSMLDEIIAEGIGSLLACGDRVLAEAAERRLR